jgi:Kef-type K+ transport system membrane component KefB
VTGPAAAPAGDPGDPTGAAAPTPPASDPIVRASWIGTLVFALTAVAAVLTRAATIPAAAVALGLFAAGIGIFFWAYAIAVNRSRTDAIGIGGLFFLAGAETAPRPVKRALLAALGAQTVVALATAAARPFTTLAFGVLVPLYGLALTGLWGARHGRFGPRRGR